jgi:antitoxin ParD1/3/4
MSESDMLWYPGYAGSGGRLMNVSLTPKLVALIEERVRSGRYQSASEVVRDALRLLEDVEQLRAARLKVLRKDVAAGLRDLDKGRSAVFDEVLADDIKAKGRKRVDYPAAPRRLIERGGRLRARS